MEEMFSLFCLGMVIGGALCAVINGILWLFSRKKDRLQGGSVIVVMLMMGALLVAVPQLIALIH